MDQSRRQFLKIMAAAPLILPFGLTASPIMRFLKPTMSPLGYFDPADQPGCAEVVSFTLSDFPQQWTCFQFMFPLKVTEFNPEKQEIREIPAFIMRTFGDEIVAYSRICPIAHGYRCILRYVSDPSNECGCQSPQKPCCCAIKASNPVLMCLCTRSAFDPANDGRVIWGPARRPPRKFDLERRKNLITIVRLEPEAIS